MAIVAASIVLGPSRRMTTECCPNVVGMPGSRAPGIIGVASLACWGREAISPGSLTDVVRLVRGVRVREPLLAHPSEISGSAWNAKARGGPEDGHGDEQ